MIIVYRPELESPPMDKDCTIGFTFLQGSGDPEHIQVKAGVTRNFPEDIWEKIKSYDVVKNLLTLGAIRIEKDDKSKVPEEVAKDEDEDLEDSLSNISVTDAMGLIEDSFDKEQLERWAAKEPRIKVRNAIAKRVVAITEGNG
jgi:hypothetical protein